MDIVQFMSFAPVKSSPEVPASVELKDDTLDLKLGLIMVDGLHMSGVAEAFSLESTLADYKVCCSFFCCIAFDATV